MKCRAIRMAEPFYHAVGFETIAPMDVAVKGGISVDTDDLFALGGQGAPRVRLTVRSHIVHSFVPGAFAGAPASVV